MGEKWRRGVEGLELQIPGGIGCVGVRSEILKKNIRDISGRVGNRRRSVKVESEKKRRKKTENN